MDKMPNSEDRPPAVRGSETERAEGSGSVLNEVSTAGGQGSSDMPALRKPDVPSSSPPRLVPLTEVMEIANGVSKMVIAHEIVINSNFQIRQPEPSEDSLESRVKEVVHKAFWDSLQSQLSKTPPQYTHAIKLLQEVKESLLSLLLPAHTRLRAHIEEVLDMELIQQQARHGALSLPQLARFITATMAMLCAPVRDQDINRLKGLTQPVPIFREIFRVLDLMKMDMANFTIRSLKPHLLQQSIQYERGQFQQFLDKQPNALDNTKTWLKTAAAETAQSLAAGSGGYRPTVLSPTLVLNQGYINLLQWEADSNTYPETMLMDRSRLQELQQRLTYLKLVASVLLVTSNVLGVQPGFVDKLKQVTAALLEGLHHRTFNLEEALLAISDQVIKEVKRSLSDLQSAPLTNETEFILKGQIRSIAQTDNPIRTLLGNRMVMYLRDALSCPQPLPGGLTPVQAELQDVASALGRVVHHNSLVFGPYYCSILTKLLLPECGTDSR
ncbi:T-complex protein 11-like protein 1 [Callorhinchus milii]|uniref:T-complex 11 family, X-linked 2 n=1 Tax=Callorhinchus milii TaxID=7868 RepID=A0A4W3KB12_CALMI|nr:T-complex protein 11-like protein 1 [Callorhinchus milii]|eukprot:gi/632953268/ref/XP_007892324.1/ PREDICTED: T-complex protein 11 homolog [Callorhinchus milii]